MMLFLPLLPTALLVARILILALRSFFNKSCNRCYRGVWVEGWGPENDGYQENGTIESAGA